MSTPERPLPGWFDDAKFGIFIHWGPSAVPGWAPLTPDPFQLAKDKGWEASFSETPYSEWYWNSMSIPGGPTHAYHQDVWGGRPYADFGPMFAEATADWDPAPWADLFSRAGARYVVLITKHHDGYCLWPSDRPSPHMTDWASPRDLVGDLGAAVRDAGLRFGTYYSGGLDWTFGGIPITSLQGMLSAVHPTEEYAEHVEHHFRELIERTATSVLWNDIGYPAAGDWKALVADYYAAVPDGVANDRFDMVAAMAGQPINDFGTPEYAKLDAIAARKWEACRGIGNSFGYNRQDTEESLIDPTELVHLLVDIVSKGGNLLLDVGPTADGSIPAIQAARLEAVGRFLDHCGDAVHGTRPWTRHAGRTADGDEVRFTTKGDDLFAIVLASPTGSPPVVDDLGAGEPIADHPADSPAYALRYPR